MKMLVIVLALLIFSSNLASALENRVFLCWHGDTVEEINKLEEDIAQKLKSGADVAEIKKLFTKYRALLNNEANSVFMHLKEIIDMAEQLADGRIPEDEVNDYALELRNRLDTIYSWWVLEYTPQMEKRLLVSLHKIALENKNSYARMEAVMALNTIGDRSSMPILKKALKDPDELVRKYASKTIKIIKEGKLYRPSYEKSMEIWDME